MKSFFLGLFLRCRYEWSWLTKSGWIYTGSYVRMWKGKRTIFDHYLSTQTHEERVIFARFEKED